MRHAGLPRIGNGVLNGFDHGRRREIVGSIVARRPSATRNLIPSAEYQASNSIAAMVAFRMRSECIVRPSPMHVDEVGVCVGHSTHGKSRFPGFAAAAKRA
jgi:hypothetical protein